jgi:hypothetical protein
VQNALRILSEARSWVGTDLGPFYELVKRVLVLVLTGANVVTLTNQRLGNLHLRRGVLIEKSFLRASRWLMWIEGKVIGLVLGGRVQQRMRAREV